MSRGRYSLVRIHWNGEVVRVVSRDDLTEFYRYARHTFGHTHCTRVTNIAWTRLPLREARERELAQILISQFLAFKETTQVVDSKEDQDLDTQSA